MCASRILLNGDWWARSASVGKGDKEEEPWLPAVVPGTVLTTLVKNGILPEPFHGLNNLRVPDIAHVGREFYTYWFKTTFNVPKLAIQPSEGDRAWLELHGINYSCSVEVNGRALPSSNLKGMFLRHLLNITAIAKEGSNTLAICVQPPDHPGCTDGGGQGADHQIAKDVTAQFVEGWDWMPPIRDRNTGIWDKVVVSLTGPVTVRDPHLVASFPGSPEAGPGGAPELALLHAAVELRSTALEPLRVRLSLQLLWEDPEDAQLCSVEALREETLELGALETCTHVFAPVEVARPHMWWPNGLGSPALYTVHITAHVQGYRRGESDAWSGRFGFRTVTSTIDAATGGRLFCVNGQRVFIRGGNWIASDGMLRLSRERYQAEVALHAHANLNMLRVWGGALAERDDFYEACDERGIMVWQEFWITGDCNGRGLPPSDPSWPLDHALFLGSARDTVRRLRTHASLALWVGGNEQRPAPELNARLAAELQLWSGAGGDPAALLDGTRAYVEGSLWAGFAAGDGRFSDGPYGIQEPRELFRPGFYPWAFNPEVGSVGTPAAETIRATMPPDAWEPPSLQESAEHPGCLEEVPNATWDYHTFIPYAQPPSVRDQVALYGAWPKEGGLDDFCEKAQLANFVQYRALLESWNSRMWASATGVLIWKTQNPWPGLRGQLYDWLLAPTGGLQGVRGAAEPVHVQLNLWTRAIEIVNSGRAPLPSCRVDALVYGQEGQLLHHAAWSAPTPLPASSATAVPTCLPSDAALGAPPVYFVLLLLRVGGETAPRSRNFYWMHAPGGDYTALGGDWRRRCVNVEADARAQRHTNGEWEVTVDLANRNGVPHPALNAGGCPGAGVARRPQVALWLQLAVRRQEGCVRGSKEPWGSDVRVLPLFASDDLVCLAPGEARTVTLRFTPGAGVQPQLHLRGWNVAARELPMKGS